MTIQGPVPGGTVQSRIWRIFWHAVNEFSNDRIPSVAASITFFFLLALFPAIACVVSLYGLFADRATLSQELQYVSGFLPRGAITVLAADIKRLAAEQQTLNFAFMVALVLAIWSASGGIKALIHGLNIAYEKKETRSFLRLTLDALGLTVIGILFATVAVALGVILPEAVARLPFDRGLAMAFRIFVWPFSFVVCVVLSSLIYRYGPSRPRAKWRWMTWGGAVSSALWMIGTVLFGWYVRRFGHYDETYGNLGAIVGFLTWIWLSLVVLLLGAEINREIERANSGM
jgi:membrane protein